MGKGRWKKFLRFLFGFIVSVWLALLLAQKAS